MTRQWGVAGVLVLGLLLTSCSEVGSAVDTANTTRDKVSACADALGLANLNPASMDPDTVRAEAGRKAERLRELGGKVSDGKVKDAVFAVADSYVALQHRHADQLGNLTQWLRTNSDNLARLRQVCI